MDLITAGQQPSARFVRPPGGRTMGAIADSTSTTGGYHGQNIGWRVRIVNDPRAVPRGNRMEAAEKTWGEPWPPCQRSLAEGCGHTRCHPFRKRELKATVGVDSANKRSHVRGGSEGAPSRPSAWRPTRLDIRFVLWEAFAPDPLLPRSVFLPELTVMHPSRAREHGDMW